MNVTIYTIANELNWLKFSISSAIENAGMKCEIIATGWNIPKESKEWMEDNGIPFFEFKDQNDFLANLYKGWNLGFEKANTEIVVPFGSDQAFYKNWLINLVKHVKRDRIIFCNLIESGVLPSRHIVKNFGLTPETFKKKDFEKFAKSISEDKLKTPEEAGLLYRGEYRLDCKPMALYRDVYLWLGGEPPVAGGDVVFIDNAIKAGIKMFQAANSISYHFQHGAKRMGVI